MTGATVATAEIGAVVTAATVAVDRTVVGADMTAERGGEVTAATDALVMKRGVTTAVIDAETTALTTAEAAKTYALSHRCNVRRCISHSKNEIFEDESGENENRK